MFGIDIGRPLAILFVFLAFIWPSARAVATTPGPTCGIEFSSDACEDPAAATDAPQEVDYLVIGGGGGGIQMALFLEKYGFSYSILEKDEVSGSFWKQFPVFRELISVNKWTFEEKHRLRYDWHSMLEAPLQMLDVTEAYFPTGTDWQHYMSEVVRLADLKIEYGSEVDRVVSNEQGKPCVIMSSGTKRCARRRIFVATGLREKEEPLLEAMGAIPYSSMTKEAARRKRVCIFGNGNAGFETAQNIFDVAGKVSIYGKRPIRVAAATKSSGDVRTKFLQVLENFHFKLMDTVDQADRDLDFSHLKENLDSLDKAQLEFAIQTIDCARIMNRDRCETSVVATGFRSHVPGMNLTSRFPATKKWWESTVNPRVHYIGWLMHEGDFRKSAGGFLAGYRYLIGSLVNHIREEDHGVQYPYISLSKDEVARHVTHRLDVASDLILLQDGIVLRDVIIPSEDVGLYRYFEGVPYQFLGDSTDRTDVIFIYFMWGEGKKAQDVFENINRYTDTKKLRNNHLHPVIEVNGFMREIGENVDIDWSGYAYAQVIESTVHAALDGKTTDFHPKPQTVSSYARAVVNMTDKVRSSRVVGLGEGPSYIPKDFVSSVVRSISSNFATDDLRSVTKATKAWMPFTSQVKLKVTPSFLTEDEIQYFLDVELDKDSPITFHGVALMPSSILQRLPRDTDLIEDCEANQMSVEGGMLNNEMGTEQHGPSAAIMTKMITSTTPLHYDRHRSTGGILGCDPKTHVNATVEGEVGFVFLNSNENAMFVHHRDGRVPVVSGSLVTFDGNIPHHTIISEGVVQLAGPFHLQTMQYIGGYDARDARDY